MSQLIEKNRLSHSKKYLWATLTIAFLFVLWVQVPRILKPLAVDEDFRNMYWVHRYQEPELFPNVAFEELGVIDVQFGPWTIIIETSSPGYSLLFQLVSNFISPLLFSKLLAFPLMLVSVFYVFRIGERLSDSGTALTLSLAFIILSLASHSEISVTSGLHRSFAFPLTLGLVHYLLNRQHKIALLFLFLNGIIYLPSFPVAIVTYALCQVSLREEGRWRMKIQWRHLGGLFIVVILVLIAVSPTVITLLGRAQEGIDTTTNGEQHVINDPERQAGGRGRLFVVFPFIGRAGLTSSAQDGLNLMILSFFAIIILLIRRSKTTKLPLELMKLLYASLTGYLLAWTAILLTSSFLFYLPSRHTRIAFFLVLLFFVGLNAQETLRLAVGWLMQKRQQFVWYLIPLAVIAIAFAFLLPDSDNNSQVDFRGPVFSALLIGLTILLLILTLLVRRRREQKSFVKNVSTAALPSRLTWIILGSFLIIASLFYIQFMDTDFYVPSDESQVLFEYLDNLPKDILIAGSPCVLNSIPFYARRAVLFSCERYLPKPQMILDDLQAYYNSEGEQLYSFCRNYGVTHLVVDEATLEPEFVAEGDYFFEPYNSILADEIMGRRDFALNHVPEAQKLFQVGSVFVIPCDSFLADLSASG